MENLFKQINCFESTIVKMLNHATIYGQPFKWTNTSMTIKKKLTMDCSFKCFYIFCKSWVNFYSTTPLKRHHDPRFEIFSIRVVWLSNNNYLVNLSILINNKISNWVMNNKIVVVVHTNSGRNRRFLIFPPLFHPFQFILKNCIVRLNMKTE